MSTELINIKDLSAEAIEATAERTIEQLAIGDLDPLKLLAFFAAVSKLEKKVKEHEVTKAAIDSVISKGDKLRQYGAEFTVVETRTFTWEDSKAWDELDVKEAEIKAAKKKIETAMKNASVETPYIDRVTGQVFTEPPVLEVRKAVRCVIK